MSALPSRVGERRTRQSIEIVASDGVALPATLYRPSVAVPDDAPAVLIASAAALEHRFYRAFAEHLVANGASAVLTYDPRGVGTGARHPQARAFRMKDWGVKDFPAALAMLRSAVPGHPVVGLGHSFGGLAFALSGCWADVERFANVASLNGYYRLLDEPKRVFTRMNILGLPVSAALGRIPARFGLGTALAGGIFQDWARWCRDPRFLFGDPSVPEAARFAQVQVPLLSVAARDDLWGTPAAIGALLDEYRNADIREIWFDPRETGHEIGHNGFFRRRASGSVWPVLTRFLLEGRWPAQTARA